MKYLKLWEQFDNVKNMNQNLYQHFKKGVGSFSMITYQEDPKWILHATKNADAILDKGFIYGWKDMDNLTTTFRKEKIEQKGFTFGYEIDDFIKEILYYEKEDEDEDECNCGQYDDEGNCDCEDEDEDEESNIPDWWDEEEGEYKYGDELVLVYTDYVRTWHNSDDEWQLIFHNDINKDNIIKINGNQYDDNFNVNINGRYFKNNNLKKLLEDINNTLNE